MQTKFDQKIESLLSILDTLEYSTKTISLYCILSHSEDSDRYFELQDCSLYEEENPRERTTAAAGEDKSGQSR
jgi:hypothetical protein